jgi:hypothetical protein
MMDLGFDLVSGFWFLVSFRARGEGEKERRREGEKERRREGEKERRRMGRGESVGERVCESESESERFISTCFFSV